MIDEFFSDSGLFFSETLADCIDGDGSEVLKNDRDGRGIGRGKNLKNENGI